MTPVQGQLFHPLDARWRNPENMGYPGHPQGDSHLLAEPRLATVQTDLLVMAAIAAVTVAFASWRFGSLKQVA